jgi:hypothetical protein
MQYFLLGVVALGVGLLLLRGLAAASPAALVRGIRVGAGSMALAGALVLVVRGFLSYAMPLAMLGSWLLWGQGGSWRNPFGGAGPRRGSASRVTTDHLEMELDHDSGAIRGTVRKGIFTGRAIEDLAPAELALLWRDCRFADPPSAQLIEAFLDRVHPSWREDMARAEAEPGPGGVMTREEALKILGLREGAGAEDIRRAHRELMLKLHPDRGGSTYLSAKINEAKDVLLGQGG